MSKIFSLLLFLPICCTAQFKDIDHPFQLGAKAHRGFIIPHSREIINVSHSNPYGFEFNAHWVLLGEKDLKKTGLVAKRGFSVYYFNFDNPKVLGHCFAAVPYVEPLIRPWGRVYGSFQLGLGAVYLSRVYDREDNPTNLFFSLPVSLWAMLNADIYFKIDNNWQATCGFNYNHISNGGMKEPNKGMNFPTANLGLQYALQAVDIKRPVKNSDWKNAPRSFKYLQLVGSIKNVPANPSYPRVEPGILFGVQGMFGRRVGRLSGLSAGLECIHDGYDRILLDRASDHTSTWKIGLLAGHELLVGRVRFTIHLGPYLYNPSRITDPVYQRYGLYYRAGRHFLFGSSLKAHRHVADVFDARVGWIW